MKPIDKICTIATSGDDQPCITRAAGTIGRGGVVIFPTRGLYGLGADVFDETAVERIFALKGRDPRKPLLALVADMAALLRVARPPDGAMRHMMQFFWPGRVTFVVPANDRTPGALTGGSGKIGIRIPGHPIAAALVRAVGGPVTGTSANLSGAGGCADIQALSDELIHGVDLILDAGRLAGGKGSTVVDICGAAPLILREGAVSAGKIMKWHAQYRRKHIDIRP